jgi:AmmeMemoRadiSam system protein A
MNQELKTALKALAKQSIKQELYSAPPLDKKALEKTYPELKDKQATFVTLNLQGQLRGCIGSLVATRSLYDDVVSNAKAAAFNDPRFKPLSVEEFENIEIELSVLSTPVRLPYDNLIDLKSKIKPGIHGVILKYKTHQATFLPQVWEQLPTFELFFQHLCTKAGVRISCLDDKAEIYVYEANKIK